MSERSWVARRWKLILNILTLVALVALAFAIRHQLGQTFRDLARVNAWALLLLIPVEALNYHAQARLYQRLFAIVGNQLDYMYLFKTSLELNFVNHVFPSGGITGVSYFSLRLRQGNLTGAKATLVHFAKLMLMFLSFEVLILLGLLTLSAMGRVNNLVILVASSLSTLLVVGTVGFFYLLGSKRRISSFFSGLTKGLNKLIQLVRPGRPDTLDVNKARLVVEDFHDNYLELRNSFSSLQAPFIYALLANITEVLAVYVVFVAFSMPSSSGPGSW